MGTEDLLADYLSKSRQNKERSETSIAHSRVQEIFDELNVPWRQEDDVWVLTSDVGEVYAGLNDEEDVLSIWQFPVSFTKPPKKLGEIYHSLLSMNADSAGAWFAVRTIGGENMLMIVGRIAADQLDPEEVALTLGTVFSLASTFE